ncbi:EAL domain, c-di-GMP-specific phosphodiesterase class I (or its enzymatically inactive variant) [Kushneria avicenniae]|uniref:EAL domain, c-di-GMP-specific phosphodiesterase class I (Or its enzymatically inactive variant) n=1 Tax=Kushneria avicenniae TaxID=402385 RepID=A0A1I1LEA5_9GAMM|nr:sensor domain-containing phosphodiesterase [Kushneria avicenniae]SFC71349.1 EAL domain, c-di-GMP-specific phosphodiesterase class I (or its enzymatically inactive variant) [Kushneria avicenniae]
MSPEQNLSTSEKQKLAELEAFRLARLGTNQLLDKLTSLMAQLLHVPTSLVTLLGSDRQWLKSKCNFGPDETSRDASFCRRTVERNDLVIVEDATLDSEFKDNPLVTAEPHIRFYAGVPLTTPDGHLVGGVCIIDYRPRRLDEKEGNLLRSFADIASGILETSNNVGFIDPVTLLPNRLRLMRDLEDLTTQSDKPHTLIFLETTRQGYYFELARGFGIDAVEHISYKIANLLRISLPPGLQLYSVMLSRMAILVPQADRQQAFDVLKDFDKRMEKAFRTRLPVRLDLKAGYHDFDPATTRARTAFRRSFCALYDALTNSETVMPYRADFDKAQRRKLELANGISAALKSDNQLYLVYQPKVCLETRQIVGFEALLRWHHPKLGTIPPLDFIPLVSQTTLINPLTLWVVREVAKTLKRFEALNVHLPVSINATTTNLVDDQFADHVSTILFELDVNAELIEIECLETEELLNNPQAVSTLDALKHQGIRIALDDFGSGYSNLKYLQRIPAQVIKLDKCLITNIDKDPDGLLIATHLIQMLQSLGFEVVAEGVEDATTAAQLEKLHCNIGQGYFFYHPMPLEEVLHVLNRQG